MATITFGEVAGGLLFSLQDDEEEGIYLYRKDEQDLVNVLVEGQQIPARRTIDYSTDRNIVWIGGQGYYLTNGSEQGTELLYQSDNISALQGELIEFATQEDNVAFVASNGFFGPINIVWTDGSPDGEIILGEINSYYTNMIKYNKFAILAEGTSNLFDPIIQLIDLESGTMDIVYEFNLDSKDTDSVISIGIQDGYYYFWSNLDETVGRELYRLEIPALNTNSTKEIASESPYQVIQTGKSFSIKSQTDQSLDVQIYNLGGQLVYRSKTASDQIINPRLQNGNYIIHVIGQDGKYSHQVSVF